MRLFFAIGAVLASLFMPTPAHAQFLGGGGIGAVVQFRREHTVENGDFRFTAEVFAEDGERDPYWGYLAVSKELLKVPDRGYTDFGMVLVTETGKPVQEARWTMDHTLPYGQWNEMTLANGRWIMKFNNECRAGTKTIFFGGKIKKGKGGYTKLFILFDITIGKRKDRRQADAIQFMVYRLPNAPRRVDGMTLINAQEAMGAGGSPLIGPEIEGGEVETDRDRECQRTCRRQHRHSFDQDVNRDRRDERNDRRDDDRREEGQQEEDPQTESQYSVQVTLEGFSSWVRLRGDNGVTVEEFVDGTKSISVPHGCKAYDFYIISSKGDRNGVRIMNNGAVKPFEFDTPSIKVSRTKK